MPQTAASVLIVDDNPSLRKTLCDILELKGFQPKSFAHGKPALSWAENEAPVVAMIDLRLSDIPGLDVLRGIKVASPRTECIVLTGHASQASAIEAINLGVYAFFQKPFDMDQLLLAIQNAVEKNTSAINLFESEERFRRLAENAQDLIYRYEFKQPPGFTYMSPASTEITGYTPNEFYADPDLIIKMTYPEDQQLFADIRQRGEVLTQLAILRWLHKNGSLVWVELRNVPIYAAEGNMVAIEGIARNITERRLALELVEKRLAQLMILNDVGSQIAAELDVNKVLVQAVKLVHESFKYHHVGLFTISEEGDELVLRSSAGAIEDLIPGQHRLRVGQGIVGWVAAQGTTFLSNDVKTEPRYVNLYPQQVKTQSELSIPIRIGNHILGVLDIQSPDRDVFDNNDVIVMETLANQIAVAFENARLYQAAKLELTERKKAELMLRERVERLRNLHEIDQAILAAQSPSEIAGIVLGDIRRLIPCDYASIVLFGGEDSYLIEADGNIAVHHGQKPSLDKTWANMLVTGKEIIINDLLVHPPEHPLPVIQDIMKMNVRSYLCLPLLVQNDLIGIINLSSLLPCAFDPDHAEIVQEMAVQVAIAIHQARLYEQIHKHASELEQRVAERTDELRQANAALTRASRMKDEFLASMSHELRTPLTGVLNLSEALQEQVYGAMNDKQMKSLKMIEESGRHLLGLINDILDLSKIEAGQFELQIESCSVSNSCQSSLQMIKGLAQKKCQRVSFSINPASIDIMADARRIKQMLVNLLSNAVKFTPNDGSIGLNVEGDMEAQIVRFTVWDEGIGIDPEDLPKLFRAFTQLDSKLSRQQPGTGLGLALVQRMADLHGGSVSVETTPGKGSRFTVTLPWIQVEKTPGSLSEDKFNAIPLLEVLTVEDKGADAAHLTRLLADLGITNIVHSYGEGVIDLAAHMSPGAILLDIYLPDKLGWDVLTDLRSDPRTSDFPVIITSVEEDRSRAAALGAVGYLVKPFSLSSLREELGRAATKSGIRNATVLVVGQVSTGPLILLAEDNEANITVYSDYLTSNNYRVTVARHGSEAITLTQQTQPDLILMDIQMPGMDGLEAIEHLRSSKDRRISVTPIIALTALAMPGDRERCLSAGANEYLSKPVRLQDLIRAINAQLVFH